MAKNMAHHTHTSRHQPGQSTYERYLRTEELLALQKPEDQLAQHDELQFQVVHQVFELWWKEAAFELRYHLHGLAAVQLPVCPAPVAARHTYPVPHA